MKDKRQEALQELQELKKSVFTPKNEEETREPLSIETEKRYRIIYSMGGPNEQIQIITNQDNTAVISGKYINAESIGEIKEIELNREEAERFAAHYGLIE
jgi:hypothetical protein